ncbi:MAG TPA: TlpA disulfide reductase family protein [Thermoanaerobaculia bacterium]|nr:TlpA disulfide reductase family protein [Thermoanaerobaculia bacterium]
MRSGPPRALVPSGRFPRSAFLFFLLSLPLIPFAPAATAESVSGFDPVGLWYARVSPTESHPVEFQVRIARKAGALAATLVNGGTSEPFSGVQWDGTTLTLEMAHYDGRIVAAPKGDGLEGTFSRVVASGTREFAFSAARTAPPPPPVKAAGASVAGTWAAEIARPGGEPEKVTGIFSQKGTAVTGTMATASGDYGPLHGTFDGEQLVLTVFNGVFVYRFTAELLPDGTLAGEFRAGKSPPADWRAVRRSAAAEAPGPKVKEPAKPFVFSLPDVDGKVVSSAQPPLQGKALIVTAMGSWCPNCHDEAPVLEALWAKYRSRGLEVVAFTYEYTDDLERSRRLVAQFRKRNGVTYPILWAGATKDAAASPLFSRVDGPRSFPTTLFLDRQHRIVAIHSGFDGPATGERFERLKKEWDERVRALLGPTAEFPVPGASAIGVR